MKQSSKVNLKEGELPKKPINVVLDGTTKPTQSKQRTNQTLNQKPVLAILDHPFAERQPCYYHEPFLKNETILHYVKRHDITLHHQQLCTLYLNQTLIPQSYWHQVKPKPQAQLLLIATVKGFHFKPLLSSVAPIALSFVAPWAGGLVKGAQWFKSAASLGVMADGSAFLHKLLPPPHPHALSQHSLSSSHRLSPTYDITGGNNRARPYQPVPLVLGKHKLIPDLAATPFTLHDHHQANYHVLLECGLGNLTLSNIKIGTVPIEQCDNIQHQIIKPGETNTLGSTHYHSVPGETLTPQGDWVVRTTSNVTTRLRVELQYQLYTVHRHNGHIARSNCQLQLQYRKVERTLQQHQCHDKDDKQNGNAHTDIAAEAVGASNTGESTSGDTSLQQVGDFNWQPFIIQHDTKQPQVISQTKGLFTIRDANLQAKVLAFTLDVPQGLYEVRMRRLTPTFVSPAVGVMIWLQLLSANLYMGDKDVLKNKKEPSAIQHDHATTQVALKIQANAALHQKLDPISVVAEQMLIDQHDVLQDKSDHALEAYAVKNEVVTTEKRVEHPKSDPMLTSLQHDDIFVDSSNPAAQFLWLARGWIGKHSCGRGGGLAPAMIDWPALTAWGRWCKHQHLACNIVFDQPQTVWQQLEIIARCGRAKPVWNDDKLSVLVDRQDMPVVQVFNEHNIVLNSVKVTHCVKPQVDEVVVRFINEEKDWQHDELRVFSNEYSVSASIHIMELLGITSERQAHQAGLHWLMSSQQVVRYQWESPVSRICTEVGDIVTIQCKPFLTSPITVQLIKCNVHDHISQLEGVGVISHKLLSKELLPTNFTSDSMHEMLQNVDANVLA